MDENREWQATFKWELNHEKGLALLTFECGKVKKSLRYVQGMYFDENNQLANKEQVEAMLYFMKLITQN